MADSKKPRKKYRPRPVARPLSDSQRSNLELAVRVHVNGVYEGRMSESSWNCLVAHFNVAFIAARDRDAVIYAQADGALEALRSVFDRNQRTGKWGCSGDERRIILEAFEQTNAFMCRCTDVQFSTAIRTVYKAVGEIV
jgi:hypothetical protein